MMIGNSQEVFTLKGKEIPGHDFYTKKSVPMIYVDFLESWPKNKELADGPMVRFVDENLCLYGGGG